MCPGWRSSTRWTAPAPIHSVVPQVKEKLGCDPILMQWPIGKEDNFEGVIDLITMEAIHFDGTNGEDSRREAIPAELLEEAKKPRHDMLESLRCIATR